MSIELQEGTNLSRPNYRYILVALVGLLHLFVVIITSI